MNLDPDFSEFIECCLAREVRFLIVGGYAVAAHGHPRYTKDLDVWVLVQPNNADRLLQALEDFGFGSIGLARADFTTPDQVVQLGQPPKRIDLLTGASGSSSRSRPCQRCGCTRCARRWPPLPPAGVPVPRLAVRWALRRWRRSVPCRGSATGA